MCKQDQSPREVQQEAPQTNKQVIDNGIQVIDNQRKVD